MSWKERYIEKYGEAAYAKRLVNVQEWRGKHPEKTNAYSKARHKAFGVYLKMYAKARNQQHPEVAQKRSKEWREKNIERVKEQDNQKNKKGGKRYGNMLIYKRTGIQGQRNRIRAMHRKNWSHYKSIIAPMSQLHHQWHPRTADYTGLALVEANPHRYGIINVIQILEGAITLYTEEGIRRGEQK